ncbi:MAG: SusC/RagA family TonB-linked outer membrane protein [Tannerella sp.]|jgi:TonB-linked SusC/RagA family outer membrane protein|nr:SusC/RagA family TonB-linked outer membrane protein [Tannerella sp.]
MKKIILLSFLCLFVSGIGSVVAQTVRVTGTVLSDDDREPVIGASVTVKGSTSRGTVTDINGNFSLEVPSSATALQISYVGMASREVAVSARHLTVVLKSATELEEIVVTALGISREKKALGYATQEVGSEAITQAASTNIASALQGKISGVDIVPSSGMPGASARITIRGARSFTEDNTPLYVIDGLPVSSTYDISTLNSVTGSDYTTRALDIDPNDIESINILKGQAASALYGMRASNGVVVITTKSGRGAAGGKASVTFNSSVSFDVVSVLPDFQTEFAQGSGAYAPSASTSWGPPISELPNDPTYGGNVENNYTKDGLRPGYYYVRQRELAGLDPWAKPQAYHNARDFFHTGVTWANHVNVAKAFEGGNASVSLGSTNQDGIIPSTGMDRYNGKFTADLKLSKHWDAGFTGNFSSTSVAKSTGANDGLIATIYGAPPSYDFAGIPPYTKDDPYTQNTYRGTGGFDGAYWSVLNNRFTEQTQRFFGNAYAKYSATFADNSKLNLKYQLGIDSYSTDYVDLFGYGHSNQTGNLDRYIITKNDLNSLFTASYSRNITDELALDLLYGNEIIEYSRKMLESYGVGFNFSGWNHLNNISTYNGYETGRRKRTFGNFGNLALSYRNMLYLNATLRNDLVSQMPPASRRFTYPSVSLGWVFSELEGLKNGVITLGKLRASYAQVGQAGDYMDSYYATPTYGGGFSSGTPIMYPIRGVTAYTLYETVYDPNLKPQNTQSYEAGFDLTLFDGLASLNYTFSRQNVKDQIFDVPLPGSTGTSDLRTNGGAVHTNAHEVTLGLVPVKRKNFRWELAFNFTKVDNYVDELAEGVNNIFLGGFVEPQVRAGIGYKFPVIYGTSFLRNEKGEIVVDADGLPMPGEDRELGTVEPDFRLGFNTGFEIFGLRLAAVFDWKQGGVMYAATSNLLDYYGVSQRSADFRKKDDFLFEWDAVKADGTPNDIRIQGANAYDYFNALNNITESMVQETSFIKLRELSLSYPVWNRAGFGVSLSAFARNLILWSALKGFDPEASQGNTNMAGGFERFSLPGSSSYGLGLNVKF